MFNSLYKNVVLCVIQPRNVIQIRYGSNDYQKKSESMIATVNKFKGVFESKLQEKAPQLYQYYYRATRGVLALKDDIQKYSTICSSLNDRPNGKRSLTFHELTVCYTLPKDLKKMALPMLVCMIPFATLIVYPLLFFFPHILLSSHFWTEEQRIIFPADKFFKQHTHYNAVLRNMSKSVDRMKLTNLKDPFYEMITCISKGSIVTNHLILKCSPLFFEGSPLGLHQLTQEHLIDLLKMHGLHVFWARKGRLEKLAAFIKLSDEAIVREGGIKILKEDQLRQVCFMRGFNPTDMIINDIELWFQRWLAISKTITHNNYSLLLHAPIIISYNYRSNKDKSRKLLENV